MLWARQGRTRGGPGGWRPGRRNRRVRGAWIMGMSFLGPDNPAVNLGHQKVLQVSLTTLCLSILMSRRGGNYPLTHQMCKSQSRSGKGRAHLIRPWVPAGSPLGASPCGSHRDPQKVWLRVRSNCAGHMSLANWPGP